MAWECVTANVADNTLQWLIRQFEERMTVLSDSTSHAAEGDPTTRKLCQRGEWQDRIRTTVVELHRLLDTIQEASVQGRAGTIA